MMIPGRLSVLRASSSDVRPMRRREDVRPNDAACVPGGEAALPSPELLRHIDGVTPPEFLARVVHAPRTRRSPEGPAAGAGAARSAAPPAAWSSVDNDRDPAPRIREKNKHVI